MPYLVCANCGKYYEIQEGETPEDFDSCQCGGNLIYVKSVYGGPKRDKTPFGKFLSNKYVLVIGIIAIVTVLIVAADYFVPPMEKMDKIMPNQVGNYEVPKSKGEMMILTDFSQNKPIEHREYYGAFRVTKNYFQPDGAVRIEVQMDYFPDYSPEEVQHIGELFNYAYVESQEIDGKKVNGFPLGNSYGFSFYSNTYVVVIFISPAHRSDSLPVDKLREEGFNFANIFIKEFNEKNIYG